MNKDRVFSAEFREEEETQLVGLRLPGVLGRILTQALHDFLKQNHAF